MSVLELTFRSEALQFDQNVTVLLPEPENLNLEKNKTPFSGEFPVLYLLHGHSDDHTAWLRRSSVERYITMGSRRLACVLPSVQNSFYTDMANGWKYYTYITEELPSLLPKWLRLSNKREDKFIAGLSMGGYGAYKLGLGNPDQFSVVASFSGVLDFVTSGKGEFNPEMAAVFGKQRNELAGTVHDIRHLLDEAIKSGKQMPRLYQSCGTADFLYENNLGFKEYIQGKGLDYTYFEEAGYGHEWAFWDSEVKKLIKWLPLREI